MIVLLGLLIIITVLDIAALRWGMDSTDNLHSLEWRRRQQRGFFL